MNGPLNLPQATPDEGPRPRPSTLHLRMEARLAKRFAQRECSFDRQEMLDWLGTVLQVSEKRLLRHGFSRLYRRIVEGV